MLLEWNLLPHAAFHLWGLPEVDLLPSSCSTQCQHYYTLESPLPLGALESNAFNHSWTFQVSYMFPPAALVPLVLSTFWQNTSMVNQTVDSSSKPMLDGGSLAPHSSQHVGRHSSVVPHHNKRSYCGCLSRPGAQGVCHICIYPFGCSVMCVTQTRVLFLSLSGNGGGNLSIYVKGLPAVLEGMGRLVCSTGCTQQCHLCSYIS